MWRRNIHSLLTIAAEPSGPSVVAAGLSVRVDGASRPDKILGPK